ncbi:MAG: hypothetical protein ACTSVI_10540 [Promethearchaeota archaeon]
MSRKENKIINAFLFSKKQVKDKKTRQAPEITFTWRFFRELTSLEIL